MTLLAHCYLLFFYSILVLKGLIDFSGEHINYLQPLGCVLIYGVFKTECIHQNQGWVALCSGEILLCFQWILPILCDACCLITISIITSNVRCTLVLFDIFIAYIVWLWMVLVLQQVLKSTNLIVWCYIVWTLPLFIFACSRLCTWFIFVWIAFILLLKSVCALTDIKIIQG